MTMRRCTGSARDFGFTLIEAIIAITIIGMTFLPIMALISQSLIQLISVEEAQARAAAMESALAMIDPINPLETPQGQIMIGETDLTWQSELIVEPNETIQIGAGLAGFNIGFYAVTVALSRQGAPWFSFECRKVGFSTIQASNGPFMDTAR